MLGYYLKFNSVSFPNPVSCSMDSSTIENVNQSEAGTDLVCVVRASKKKWSMKFNLTSMKRDALRAVCLEESVIMNYMGNNYTVRVRDLKENLVENSEWVARSNGLYECSVTITEF